MSKVNCWNILVVMQNYETNAGMEYAIRGNAVVLKCQVPSFVADFVTVVSWHTSKGEDFFPTEKDGTFHKHLGRHLIHTYTASSILKPIDHFTD